MKTVRNNQLFFFLLMAVVLLNCCQPDNSGHPCDEPYIQETRLDNKYDSLFPYNHTSKRLTYLYSNDTIENDTMVFELVDYVNWDIDTTSAERCFIDYQEVQRLLYKSEGPIFKKLTIYRVNGSFSWEARDLNSPFSHESLKNPDFRAYTGVYYNDQIVFGEIISSVELNGKHYFNVYKGLDAFNCEEPGSRLWYSHKFGFLEMYDTCHNELFTLIK
ncbi:MAG: hypothetical protein KDC92_04085 [Bacteroidetes bacterium]|nr:hypothetical protein [Bacteroidota bacterium]